MPELTLSPQQEAEIVSDLARGRVPTQIAARRHLPVMVVEACATRYGPDRAAWSRNSRELNKRLRDEPSDLTEDEPVTDAVEPSRFYTCSWPGCEHTINWEQSTPEALVAVQQLINEHAATHRPATEDEPSTSETTPTDTTPAPSDQPDSVADPVIADESATNDASTDEGLARSIDQLLETAAAIGTTPITDHAAAIQELAGELRQLIDDHHATNRRREEILAELRVLEAREADLYNELVDLGAEPLKSVAKPDHTGEAPVSNADVWWDLAREVKAKVRPWAIANNVPHSITGRQPASTVAAYLAAHPEDDPR